MAFFDEIPKLTDPVGIAIRDLEHLQFQRRLTGKLWEQFRGYAEPAFLAEAGRQFHSRFWEMYLGVAMLCSGKSLMAECRNQDAPDLCIEDHEVGRVWVEAVAPQRGSGSDAVPLARLDRAVYIDEEKIILRLTSVLAAKRARISEHRASGVIGSTDPCVIAINGWQVPDSDSHFQVPYMVKAVFPVGRRYVLYGGGEVLEAGYQERRAIERTKGAQVRTDSFLNPEYSLVSGVLFSRASGPYLLPTLGSDFIFIHNPGADNPLPLGWLQVGKEYWVERDELRVTNWGKGNPILDSGVLAP